MTSAAPASPWPRWQRRGFLLLVLFLCALRFEITAGIPTDIQPYGVDDLHYLKQARHLAEGNWFGPFDNATLIKGPGYPAFLAAAHHEGVPRRAAEDLLRILAALVMLVALRRLGTSRAVSLLAFALALFSIDAFLATMQRATREHVYASQTLLIVGLAGNVLASRRMLPHLGWLLVLAIVGSWFDLTREEGPWILPTLAVFGVALWCCGRARGLGRGMALARVATSLMIPLAVVALGARLVRDENERRYGAPVLTEQKDSEFTAALAALRRLSLHEWERFEPISKAQRTALYAASPAFAELEPRIEGPYYDGPSMYAANGERKFSFFTWLLRDAVAAAGHYGSLADARRFYRRLADEVNAACDAGSVPSAGPVSSSHPGIHPDGWGVLVTELGRALRATVKLEPYVLGALPAIPPSDMSLATQAPFRSFLQESIPPPGGARQRERLAAMLSLNQVLRSALPWLVFAGAALWLAALLRPRRALASPLVWITAAVVTTIATRSFLIAVIETYWWHYAAIYLSAVGPLVAMVPALGLAAAAEVLIPPENRVLPWLRDGVAVLLLVVAATATVSSLQARRDQVLWPLDARHQVALRTHGSRAAVSVRGCEVRRRRGGLGIRPASFESFITNQPFDQDQRFTDALIELDLPGRGTQRLDIAWNKLAEPRDRPYRRSVHVPRGRRVALRLPLEENGVSQFVLSGLPPGEETRLRSLGCVPPRRAPPARPQGGAVRAWLHRLGPRQIICEVRDAAPDTKVLVQFSLRRRESLAAAPGVKGALEIDLDAPLLLTDGKRLELRLETDARGFATKSLLLPDGVVLPVTPLFVQAVTPDRFLPSAPVEALRLGRLAELDLRLASSRR